MSSIGVTGSLLYYHRTKLWPQGPVQTQAAQLAFEVWKISQEAEAIQKKPATERTPDDEELLRREVPRLPALRDALEKLRTEMLRRADVMPIECVVGDIYQLTPEAPNNPAIYEVVGEPFGQWEAFQQIQVARVPTLGGTVMEATWPVEEFLEYQKELESDDKKPGEDDDEEDEDDDEEDELAEAEDQLAKVNDLAVQSFANVMGHPSITMEEGGPRGVGPDGAPVRVIVVPYDVWDLGLQALALVAEQRMKTDAVRAASEADDEEEEDEEEEDDE